MTWSIKKLVEVTRIIMGQSPPSSTYNEKGDGLPFFQGKAEFGETYPAAVKYCSTPIRIVEADDVLICVRAPVGIVNIAKDKSCIGRGLAAVRADSKILNQRFLYYFLKLNENNWSKLSTGSTFVALRRKHLENLKISLPLLNIQHQIAKHLDAIRKAQELNDKQIALADELFQSLLSRELDPKGTDRKMNKLEEVAEIIMGQSPPSNTYNTKRNGLPFFQGKFEFGEIYPVPIKFCSQPLRIAKKNDVLLSVRAPVGPVNLAPSECCIGRGLSAIRAKAEKLDQLFLFYFMKLNEERMSLLGCGSTFNAIGRDHIEKIKISLPPLQTQRQIVEKLQAVQDYKKKLLEQKQKLKELFNSCLDKTMKGEL